MIDRILYAAVALALAAVFMLDGNFAENLYRGIDVRLASHSWETWLCAIFLLLIGAAVYKELR